MLLEMQRIWPRWELRLLLSISTDDCDSAAPSPTLMSSVSSTISWAFTKIRSNLPNVSSFAGYISRDSGKGVWEKACDRSDNDQRSMASGDRVAMVRGTQSWQLVMQPERIHYQKNEYGRPSRDALRQAVATLVLMSDRAPLPASRISDRTVTTDPDDGEVEVIGKDDCEDEEHQQLRDRALQLKRRRVNFLRLYPSEVNSEQHNDQMWELAKKVKQSMQEMNQAFMETDDIDYPDDILEGKVTTPEDARGSLDQEWTLL